MNNRKFFVSLFENWPVKALSIALALVLFIFNRLNTQTARALLIPLSIETNGMLVPASDYPANVQVSLRGDNEGIKSIVDNDIEAYVDFIKYETGDLYSAPVQIRRKGTALGIEPLEITVKPVKIALRLDRKGTKIIPLTVAVRGRVVDGFDLVSHSIAPAETAVTGPLSVLETVSELKTYPVDLDGRNNDFTVEVGIYNPNSLLTITGNGLAQFSGVIRSSVLTKNIDNIPIAIAGLDPVFEVQAEALAGSARIEGTQSRLDSFRLPAGFFTVDCSSITAPGTYTLPVAVNVSGDVFLLSREPENVALIVTVKQEQEPAH